LGGNLNPGLNKKRVCILNHSVFSMCTLFFKCHLVSQSCYQQSFPEHYCHLDTGSKISPRLWLIGHLEPGTDGRTGAGRPWQRASNYWSIQWGCSPYALESATPEAQMQGKSVWLIFPAAFMPA
jgi:hypothetical protein